MAVALAKQLKCNGFKNFAGLGLEPHIEIDAVEGRSRDPYHHVTGLGNGVGAVTNDHGVGVAVGYQVGAAHMTVFLC
jgi:hypothetical protein